jgi:protoporphyrinogen oxidase
MGYYFEGRLHSWGTPLALLKFPHLDILSKLRYAAHVFLSTRRSDWTALDGLEATSWIKRWVGPRAYDVLWKNLFEFKFYQYANSLSAAWIWSRIRRIGLSRESLLHEKLGYLEGGSKTLLDALGKYITDHGGEIHLKCPIRRVGIENGRVTGLELADGLVSFDKVISTVPLPYLERLIPGLPDDITDKLHSLDNIAVVCVVAKLRKPVTGYFWLNVNDSRMNIPGIVEYTNLRPLEHHLVYLPYYMPGELPDYELPDSHYIDISKQHLKNINPVLQDSDFIDMHASRYRFAQPVCTPGFLQRLPPVDLPITGLYAADTSYYYPEDRGISESVAYGRKIAKMIR